jgi:hypothetical protein
MKSFDRMRRAGLVRGELDAGEYAGSLIVLRVSLTDEGRAAVEAIRGTS